MSRQQIAAANWKMNLTWQQGEQLLEAITAKSYDINESRIAVFAVPFPYLPLAAEKLKGKSHMYIAAQNCSNKNSGAHTGEVSAEMLVSLGIKYVVLGHSERREYYSETNQLLAEKINIALEYGLTPIFCCGEPLQIREAGTQNEYVAKQLEESLYHLTAGQLEKIVIAYEPIWAIGTGKTASKEQAQEMHAAIRAQLATKYGADIADFIPVLYGGSVKANNARDIFAEADVDGGLVGGASLIVEEFATIISSLK